MSESPVQLSRLLTASYPTSCEPRDGGATTDAAAALLASALPVPATALRNKSPKHSQSNTSDARKDIDMQ
ncbi:unnamed protein product [Penicillium bialowiezense]